MSCFFSPNKWHNITLTISVFIIELILVFDDVIEFFFLDQKLGMNFQQRLFEWHEIHDMIIGVVLFSIEDSLTKSMFFIFFFNLKLMILMTTNSENRNKCIKCDYIALNSLPCNNIRLLGSEIGPRIYRS